MPRRRGNPNWGRSGHGPSRAIATEFEMQVRRLGLAKEAYVDSTELRIWCERNKNHCYIPGWLLKAFKIKVEADVDSAA